MQCCGYVSMQPRVGQSRIATGLMATIAHKISEIVRDPQRIVFVCWFFVAGYYVLTFFFIRAADTTKSVWRKNGFLDISTSILWCSLTVWLLRSLFQLASTNNLPLTQLIQYYFLLIFLFAFIYGLIEWHWPGMLTGVGSGWEAELRCLLISIQTITTLGYTTSKPARGVTEFIASVEGLLGIFFLAVFVAKAVNAAQ